MVLVGGAAGNIDEVDDIDDEDDEVTNSPHRSKIFIRLPKTLFTTEDELEAKKPDIGE